ncbi:hypothetical protein K7X08_034209 [Anisodus acutangulus]|uniref:Uncharacterized protein n=1 Tax=Anisodus acutangulus TaxID=402998 RepID=A0A9Q1LIM9_9SOLA|nr:hypothetical protein K7X08_034209 [Anisodus acutangulus]
MIFPYPEQVHGQTLVAGDGVVPIKEVHEVNMQADQTESSVKENKEVTDSHLVTTGDGVKDTLWNVISDEEVAKIEMSQSQFHRTWSVISDEDIANKYVPD